MMRITDTVKHLLIINVIFFIGTLTVGNGHLFNELFSLHFPESDKFQLWQIISHMFMHGDFTHLAFNMFGLWMFGSAVEQQIGRNKFLFIYFSAGLGAVLFQLGYYYYEYYQLLDVVAGLDLSKELLHDIVNFNILDGDQYKGELLQKQLIPLLNENGLANINMNEQQFRGLFDLNIFTKTRMVGASGCLMGILAAYGVMFPNAELMMIFLPIPIKAKYFIPGVILLDIISAFSGQSFFSPSNTAYLAHVGGAVIGFIIMWYWKKNSFNKYRWD